MEALYAKLYSRYTKLKKEKDSQLDELNRKQELNFLDYVAAADEMIDYLKNENDRLQGQVDELKSELASVRSSHDEQHDQYETLLREEKQKNKELYNEIARLQKLERNECSHVDMPKDIEPGENSSQDAARCDRRPAKSPHKSVVRSLKKRKTLDTAEGGDSLYGDQELDRSGDQYAYGDKGSDAPPSLLQSSCCQRRIGNAGRDDNNSSINCIFQYLVEFVIGMKVCPVGQNDDVCILAQHQSSGYSFSLTWITNSHGEIEMLYQVSSLGTLERVAPEWMKETLMFNTCMSKIFFERVSRVLKS